MGCCSSTTGDVVEVGTNQPIKKAVKPVASDIIQKKCDMAKKTKALPLRECGLKTLPAAATGDGMSDIKTCDLCVNNLKTLPDSISCWKMLQTLQCANNSLQTLPTAIGELSNLHKLILTGNQLQTLPVELSRLGSLKFLSLDQNQLGPTLPDDLFSGMNALEEVNLSGNRIETLPSSVANLIALQRLLVPKNLLVALPEGLGSLQKLQQLDAAENKITAITPAIFKASRLDDLWLKGNPVDRYELQKLDGFDAFLQRRKARKDKTIDSKVVATIDLTICGLD